MLASAPALSSSLSTSSADGTTQAVFHSESFVLPSGLRVVLSPNAHAPNIAVSMWYHVGAACDPLGQSGRAHLFEHVFKNSKHVKGHHYEILRNAGALSANAATSVDRTSFYEVVPSHLLDLALWIESDRMGYFAEAFTDERLLQQQDVVVAERQRNYENIAFGSDQIASWGLLHPHSSLRHGIIGTSDEIRGMQRTDMLTQYKTWFVPANATLCITGGDRDTVVRAVEKYFASFPVSVDPWLHTQLDATRADATSRSKPTATEVTDRLTSLWRMRGCYTLPKLSLAQRVAMEVFLATWGRRGTGSLWQQCIREPERAVRQSAHVASYRHYAEFHMILDAKDRESLMRAWTAAEASLDQEIADFNADDIRRYAQRRDARVLRSFEAVLSRNNMLQRSWMQKVPDLWQQEAAALASLTASDAKAIVRETLQWRRMHTILTVPSPHK